MSDRRTGSFFSRTATSCHRTRSTEASPCTPPPNVGAIPLRCNSVPSTSRDDRLPLLSFPCGDCSVVSPGSLHVPLGAKRGHSHECEASGALFSNRRLRPSESHAVGANRGVPRSSEYRPAQTGHQGNRTLFTWPQPSIAVHGCQGRTRTCISPVNSGAHCRLWYLAKTGGSNLRRPTSAFRGEHRHVAL